MHQPLSDESLILPTNSVRALHPTLRRALGVLDARLEDELDRYRRYRAGLSFVPSSVSALKRSVPAPVLDLPTTSPAPQSVEPLSEAITVDEDEDITVDQTPIAADAGPPLPPRTPLSFQNDLPADASSALVIAAAQDGVADDSEATDPDALIGAADLPQGGFLTDDAFATDSSGAPNDYLESSEELLRSLAEEEATVAAERNVLEGLLTPFGVGSMLLMLLGSGMFGYLIMNPASLTAVKDLAMKVASFRSSQSSLSPTTIASVDVDGGTGTTDIGWLSNSPALDSNEFLNLSLGNISALRTRAGGLSLLSQPGQGAKQDSSPLMQLDSKATSEADKSAKATPKSDKSAVVITGLTPLSVKPITPPAPAIAPKPVAKSASGGLFSGTPVRVRPAPRPPRPAPRVAPKPAPIYSKPSRPARSYEPPAPSYQPPAPSYQPKPKPVYNPPPVSVPVKPAPVKPLPPPPVEVAAPVKPAPAAIPEPKGDYRVVTPYTNDAALESAQKSNSDASFRNLDDGAYVQYGGSYSSKAEADAKAAELRQQGVEAEIK
ncbi:hypothetical protein IQ266_23185 [filamentous cyanobacterium LEGE 11480]|uniref:SPOR domain-containing protein n=1 Tax=Romeriopsis navalis LEGE 11480 TaxID=2777977 RepID=A0A928VQ65_9CYAN|nr:hypothetical protein [Romeriopsis navalis]MBE9032646.1 hypothetical protein [Romeriopsis navalis LEGE 11480]